MRLEIESAANFLSDLLRLHSQCLAPQQLEQFRLTIIDHLLSHYQKHWFPEKPFKGSGYRCLRINHKMDPMLAKAGLMCGLNDSALRTFLPNELTLWIDPNEVSYRIGENGSICVIYDADSYDNSSSGSQTNRHSNYSRMTPSPPSSHLSTPLSSSMSSNSSTQSSPSSSPNWYNNYERVSPPSHLVSAKKSSFYLNSLLS
jgi:protein Tob/BTG